MKKINIKILIFITLIFVTFLGLNIIINLLYFPKFIQTENSLINLDFNETDNLEANIFHYDKYLNEYTKDGIYIENLAGKDNSPALILDVKNNNEYIHFVINNNNYNYLKVEAVARLENIKATKQKFPAIWLYIEDSYGKRYWDMPHFNKNFFTVFKWKKIKNYYYIPSFADKIHFVISNNSISGKMICDDIKLTPYKINSTFKIYRSVIYIIFFILLIIVLLSFYKFILIFLKQIIILIIIIAGILGPKKYLYRFAYIFNLNALFIQKAGHFIMFFLLSFFLYFNKKYFENNKNFKYLLIIELVLIAVLTEMLQFFTFSRTMTFTDCLIDSSGIILGIISADILKFKKENN